VGGAGGREGTGLPRFVERKFRNFRCGVDDGRRDRHSKRTLCSCARLFGGWARSAGRGNPRLERNAPVSPRNRLRLLRWRSRPWTARCPRGAIPCADVQSGSSAVPARRS